MNTQGPKIPWWLIILGFVTFWPLGIVLLCLNMASDSRASKRGENDQRLNQARNGSQVSAKGSHVTYNGADGASRSGSYNAQPAARQPGPLASLRSSIEKKVRSGRIMTALGGIASFVFLLGLVSEVGDYGFAYVSDWFPMLGLSLAGLFTMFTGLTRTRLGRRQRLYLGAIGSKKSIFLSDLAAAAGVSEKKVMDDIQKMLSDGTLPMGYIDRASGRLVLSEEGFQRAPRETREEASAPVVHEATQEDKDRATLLQIRAINDAIPGDEMSRKIDRIEEITGKILSYAREHPQKSAELRQFLNYYLPTTLKILHAYAQMDAQGVEGENITATKERIEGMMDKVVEGFEKQLDQLFRADAMDITSDVEVLERMLQKDGLSGGQEGITLTLEPSAGSYRTGSAAATQSKPK